MKPEQPHPYKPLASILTAIAAVMAPVIIGTLNVALRDDPCLVWGDFVYVARAVPLSTALACAIASAGLTMATWWTRTSALLLLGGVVLLAAAMALAAQGVGRVIPD